MHHAYRGGLLEHVVSMAELAVLVASHYRDLDRDLLLLGVLFHDLGKLQELGAMPVNDYTLEGRLVGHVVIGRDLLRERCAAIPGFPADLQLLLEHMVLSHQGRKEYASPVEPMTPEALALHYIDDLDSKLNQFTRFREQGTGVLWHRGLGRHVYLTEGAPGGPAERKRPRCRHPRPRRSAVAETTTPGTITAAGTAPSGPNRPPVGPAGRRRPARPARPARSARKRRGARRRDARTAEPLRPLRDPR